MITKSPWAYDTLGNLILRERADRNLLLRVLEYTLYSINLSFQVELTDYPVIQKYKMVIRCQPAEFAGFLMTIEIANDRHGLYSNE